MSIRKLRAGRVPAISASQYVGERGTIFWNDLTGALRLSDGITPGGVQLPMIIASSTEIGGVKLGPGVILNNDNQIIIDSTGLAFNFGDFQATTPGNGAATLSSIQSDQDIAIVSNGTGVINMVGDFHIHRTADYNPAVPDADGAVFAVKSDGQIQMKVPLSDSTTGAFEIVGNDTGLFVPPNQTGVILHVTGNSGLVSRNYFDANANYSLIVGRRYNGTQSSISKVLSGEMFFRIAGQASNDNGFATFGPVQLDFVATQDQTPTAQGGEFRIRATPNDTTSQTGGVIVATFNATTGVTATKFNGPLTGNVTGKADTAGNADTVTNGVYTNGSYANPAWITSLAASKVGLGNVTNESKATMFTSPTFTGTVSGVTKAMVGLGAVENTALSTWAGSTNITTVGTLGSLAVTGLTSMGTFTGKYVRTTRDAGTISDGGTVTIDFSTDAIVYFTWANGVNLAYSNYTAGRIVKVIAKKATGTGTDSLSLDGITAANVSNGTTSVSGNADNTYFIELTCTGTTIGSVYAKV